MGHRIPIILGLTLFLSGANAQIIPAVKQPCPENYILVPPLAPYTSKNFCVMKYEAKNQSGKAVSKPTSTPWTNIVRGAGPQTAGGAWKACRDIGKNYDLISNAEWQTIARNISSVSWNWIGGVVNDVALSVGHSDSTPISLLAASPGDADHCYAKGLAPAVCSSTVWNLQRRTHKLSNGGVIWDFGGNASELVSTPYYSDLNFSNHIAIATGLLINLFGPASSCNMNAMFPFCGFGDAYAIMFDGVLSRGGSYNDGSGSGIFTVNTQASAMDPDMGFRCVFHPPNDTDPCGYSASPPPTAGTVCTGGALYAGFSLNGARYMVTPGGCGAGTSPTCTGGTDYFTAQYSTSSANHSATSPSDGALNTGNAYKLGNTVAAAYCQDLVLGGYDDWFLPSPAEFANIAGLAGSLKINTSGSYYWSSQATSITQAYAIHGNLGTSTAMAKTLSSTLVRCMRRY